MPQRRAQATTKRSRMPQRRPHVPQLRPDAAKKKKEKERNVFTYLEIYTRKINTSFYTQSFLDNGSHMYITPVEHAHSDTQTTHRQHKTWNITEKTAYQSAFIFSTKGFL